MKKNLIVLMLALCMAFTGTACKGQKEDTKKEDTVNQDTAVNKSDAQTGEIRLTSVAPNDIKEYIDIAQYDKIVIKKEIQEVTEDQIDAQITKNMQESAAEVDDPEAVIQTGDIANIDYKGLLNGEAFDGGTDTGSDLTIGSGMFIDGFEDGLLGAKKGEQRNLNLTFPEAYPSAELAGQDVVFEVKVNSIKRPPELTDAWVKENTGYKDVAAYRDSLRVNLEENQKITAESTLKSKAWSQVFDGSEVKKYPKEDLENEKNEYNRLMEFYAKQADMTLEEMIKAQGMTQDQYDAQCQQYAETMVKQCLIAQYIMDQEGITFDGEEAKSAMDEILQSYGVESKEKMVEQFGEMSVNESIGVIVAGDFIMKNAKIEDVVVTEDGKNGVDADAEAETTK